MAKKHQPPNPVEQLQSYFDRWDNLYEHGGSDPFYADGSGLNMLRNQIVYGKEAIEKSYSNGDCPEIYYRETPPEVSQDFMVDADGIRLAAKAAMEDYRQDENLQFLLDHADALPPKIAKNLCIGAVIGYATGLESAIAQDDLITMRRHKTHGHYLESFKSCADGIRKFQLAETAPLAEKIISKPIQIREKKEYVNMEKATLQVEFPQEKLEALEFYMSEKGLTIEDELQDYVNTLYEKNIPASTRKYLDRNDEPRAQQEEKPESASKTAQNAEERLAFNAARREKRKAEKEQKQSDAPAVGQEIVPEDEPVEEEAQGMSMSM